MSRGNWETAESGENVIIVVTPEYTDVFPSIT